MVLLCLVSYAAVSICRIDKTYPSLWVGVGVLGIPQILSLRSRDLSRALISSERDYRVDLGSWRKTAPFVNK